MSKRVGDVQRIVLRGTRWQAGQHLMLDFGHRNPLHFLRQLLDSNAPTRTDAGDPTVQISLGFTRRGLQKAHVPELLLGMFALQSPAFWQGAAQRAAGYTRLTDGNAPEHWTSPFSFLHLDAVLSLHSADEAALDDRAGKLADFATDHDVKCEALPRLKALKRPVDVPASPGLEEATWVHFGYRDSLSRIDIKGVTTGSVSERCRPTSRHEAGEFLLGHEQDSGANPWIAGPSRYVWSDEFRSFFRNGSFGVLQQIEQDVSGFEAFVRKIADDPVYALPAEEVKGKLCGRYPDGRSLATPPGTDPKADFDYAHDDKGHGCPFGSHVRRMNPRLPPADPDKRQPRRNGLDLLAQFSQTRPLLRRGMPYGPEWTGKADSETRGLVGQFFCASIEDQFEHLLGEWADRVPLGSPDRGGARDPFVGAHETSDGPFEIPGPGGSVSLPGLQPFIRTVGAAYLFYPSLTTLCGIAADSLWGLDDR